MCVGDPLRGSARIQLILDREVLFCRNIHQKGAKTGEHTIRPPLVEEVKARYAQQERARGF
jgi:hypothetical protein